MWPDPGPAAEAEVKAQVRRFYDSVGWHQIGKGLYQNARYEDLRPVAQEYIRRCHQRVARHLPANGRLILDAGSGPIQYPEYLEYSRGFDRRVCLDISRLALVEARRRIGEHGMYVVGDVANLPFRAAGFDALVSLHTVHHLPAAEHRLAFDEFHRVLAVGARAVVVYSWGSRSAFDRLTRGPIRLIFRLMRAARKLRAENAQQTHPPAPTGTFTYKHDFAWIRRNLAHLPGLQVRVWRSVSTSFTRAFIHRQLLGKAWLRLLFWVEERAPHFFGRAGQYPMIIFDKSPAKAE
jgi:ubiquinone/menaquinone biosynthesis C-methylase UbiE